MIKKEEPKPRRWIWIVGFLFFLFLLASIMTSCVALFSGENIETTPAGNVALIKVHGVIQSTEAGGFFDDSVASADTITELLQEAEDNDAIKAIILEINSPGGSAVASEEIVSAIKKSEKPVVSYIREAGASGGYWIASSTDHIFASRMSITGSVGVIASYLEFSGFLNRYNITYQRLAAGKYKDIGTPLRKMTATEQDILQDQLDLIHGFFLDDVISARNLTDEEIEVISTGQFFIGQTALELNLIDEIGGKDEAVAYTANLIGEEVELAEYERAPTLLELFGAVMSKQSFAVGQGIGDSLTRQKTESQLQINT